ncbi:hypothetical protein GALL_542320 [mine drainage metagenome]|uniref:DUF8198 domain-containing protein n=1 Tax=mine drainage metagenome TaxID=410659 RepID=A0A1J5PG44_9ZZZZ
MVFLVSNTVNFPAMKPSTQIRHDLARVSEMRARVSTRPDLATAIQAVKQFQAQRFASTYADLLADPTYAGCAEFFMQELYSGRDYSERDAQFARIASTIERTFPQQVIATTVTLAQLHCTTEELDLAMAQHWSPSRTCSPDQRYLHAWQAVDQRERRMWQLGTVLSLGKSLSELTRKRGLRLMLKMMRGPAKLAGLGTLQEFLEAGFDRFSGMAKDRTAVDIFLDTIQTRESAWINWLFAANQAGLGQPGHGTRKL